MPHIVRLFVVNTQIVSLGRVLGLEVFILFSNTSQCNEILFLCALLVCILNDNKVYLSI